MAVEPGTVGSGCFRTLRIQSRITSVNFKERFQGINDPLRFTLGTFPDPENGVDSIGLPSTIPGSPRTSPTSHPPDLNEFPSLPPDPAATAWISKSHCLLVGKWISAASGETFPTLDPATGETLCNVPSASAGCGGGGPSCPRRIRTGPLAANDPIRERTPPVAPVGPGGAPCRRTRSPGIPRQRKTRLMVRHVDIPFAVDVLRYMAGWATKIHGTHHRLVGAPYAPDARFFAYTPASQWVWWPRSFPELPAPVCRLETRPALATGCTTILKPAEQTPLSALRLGNS